MFLLKAYIAIHKFDIICLSETYLDSSTTSDDDNLAISGYNLIRSDHPSNNKRCGVCIYYKNFLHLRVLSIQYLQEYINFELNIGGKICNFISLYTSPSQTQDEPNIHVSTKFDNWLWCTLFIAFKLSSSDSFYKI